MLNVDQPVAAYLYTLSLDQPGLAWEYLRRNAGYRGDWSRHGGAGSDRDVAKPWGLRFP